MTIPPSPSLRELCLPVRSFWLFCGVFAGWLWSALPVPWNWSAPVLLLAAIFFARGWCARLTVAIGLLLQLGCFHVFWQPVPEPEPIASCHWELLVKSADGHRTEVQVLSGPSSLRGSRMRLTPPDLDVHEGDTLLVLGGFRPPQPAGNPGGFDAGRWMAQAGLTGTVRVITGEPVMVHRSKSPPSRRTRVTKFVRRKFGQILTPPAAALWGATALGETSGLPPEVSDAFRATGIFHMLAVSGSHMVLLGGAVLALLRLFRLPRLPAWLGSAAVVWVYTWMLEWPLPVLRASIAYTALALAMAGGRKPHASGAWFLSAAALICLDPNSPFNAGVQLSFAAVAGLLWVAPQLRRMMPAVLRRGKIGSRFTMPLLASLGASLMTAPLLAWQFQAVPWIGIPLGLATSLFFESGFLASLLALALAGAGLPLPFWWGFARAADGFAWICLQAVLRSAEMFHGTIDVARPPASWMVLGLCFPLFLALWGTAWRRLAAGCSVIWLMTLAAVWFCPPPKLLEAWFLDVGQGDATLLRFPSGRAWLVDAGPRSDFSDAGARVIGPSLRALGIGALDAVVITHPDLDHAGGLDTLMSAFPIGHVFVSAADYPDTPSHWRNTVSRLQRRGILLRRLGAGMRLGYGDGVSLRVLAPGRAAAPSVNASSVVMRADYGKSSLLLTGDAEGWSERHQQEDRAPLRAEVLKVGHHGSRSSSAPSWLREVRPKLALLSAGATNRYGHPAPEVIARLHGLGAAHWVTARHGGLHVRFGPDGFTALPAEPRFWRGPWRRNQRLAFTALAKRFQASRAHSLSAESLLRPAFSRKL